MTLDEAADVVAEFMYYPAPGGQEDLNLALQKLLLTSDEPFTKKSAKEQILSRGL